MASRVGSKPQDRSKRKKISSGQNSQVFNPEHNVVLLKSDCILGDHVKIPEIFFGRFQFYNCKSAFGRRSGKIFSGNLIAAGYGGHKRPVAVGVLRGDKRKRILASQGFINLFFRVCGSIAYIFYNISGLNAGSFY